MVFKLTSGQYLELKAMRNDFPAPALGNSLDYAVLYDKVLEYVYDYVDAQGGNYTFTNSDFGW